MKVLGFTGGIGSGKTYVIDIFRHLGIPAYCSDKRARELYTEDVHLLAQMEKLLGEGIVRDGVLQTDMIARRIFGDRNLLEGVERLVHPAVLKDFGKWKEQQECRARQKGEKIPFVIFESAILLEKPLVKEIADKVVTVSAPLELRVERVMRRDGTDRDSVMKRISSQWNDGQREALSDFIIFADGKEALLPQVLHIMEAMSKKD